MVYISCNFHRSFNQLAHSFEVKGVAFLEQAIGYQFRISVVDSKYSRVAFEKGQVVKESRRHVMLLSDHHLNRAVRLLEGSQFLLANFFHSSNQELISVSLVPGL
jgi:hypothetical protein